ncbi:unnamed protein product [Trichogramma brassicae]|uniref:Uncharacterized protein n=1 Tax=Trichogramma brassicae TaxID=86971 RepID=A0A6H5IWT5_9HYME|nr:unnamed protein product [Trichogramma brassicae]
MTKIHLKSQRYHSLNRDQKSYIQAIHKKHPEKELTLEEYPHLDFDHKSKKMTINPALELSKAICKNNSVVDAIPKLIPTQAKPVCRIIFYSIAIARNISTCSLGKTREKNATERRCIT